MTYKDYGAVFVLSFTTALSVTFTMSLIFKFVCPPLNVVTLDVSKLIKRQAGRLGGNGLEEKKALSSVEDFSARFKDALQEMASTQKMLILRPEAVVKGASDITDTFEQRLEEAS